ncbi:MAG: nicotinate-nucleotide adenylyltransferase [Actinomycetota bacterium]
MKIQNSARLGIMGGTFDPIHIGHLIAASEVARALDLSEVLFVPAGSPWQKSLYSSAEDRLMMTTLAVADHERFSVSRIEIDRRGPTYSADTVARLSDFYGEGAELFFILGSDAAAGLSTWMKLDEFTGKTNVVVVTRPGDPASAVEGADATFVPMPLIDVSSTDIRARVREGRPISYLVPPAVESYIRANGLYSTQEEVKDAQA